MSEFLKPTSDNPDAKLGRRSDQQPHLKSPILIYSRLVLGIATLAAVGLAFRHRRQDGEQQGKPNAGAKPDKKVPTPPQQSDYLTEEEWVEAKKAFQKKNEEAAEERHGY